MSAYFPTGADYLQRTAGLASLAGDFTWCAWVRQRSLPPGYNTGFGIFDAAPPGYAQWSDTLFLYNNRADLETDGAAAVSQATTSLLWTFFAVVRSGTTHRYYVNCVLVGSQTIDVSARTAGAHVVGGDSFGDGDLDVAYVREWQSALSLDQLYLEQFSRSAITAGALIDTSLETGPGSWTEVGTPVYDATQGPFAASGTRLYPLVATNPPFGVGSTSIGYPAGYYGSWDKVQAAGSTASVVVLHPEKYGSGAPANITNTDTSATTPYRVGVSKLISIPLKGPGTIAGTLQCCIGVQASNADADFATSLHVWVSQGTTPAIRGTLLANHSEGLSPATEWPTTQTFVSLGAPAALTPVDYEDGDRIIIEFGFVSYNAFSTSRTGTVRRGAVAGAPPAIRLPDAVAGATTTTTQAGWFEFSQALTFLDPPVNDLWENATVIPPGADIVNWYDESPGVNIERASWSPSDPNPSCAPNSRYTTRWWTFTAPANGFLYAIGLGGGTDITGYTGTPFAFVEVQCDTGWLTMPVVMGTTYSIKVVYPFAGGAIGAYLQAYFFEQPTNDACATPEVIASLPYSTITSSLLAPDDTFISGNFSMREYNALFWEWTCPPGFTGNLEVDTAGSDFGSQICITTGACGARTEITNAPWLLVPASEDEDGFIAQAKVVLRPTVGTTYSIRITSVAPGGGRLVLNIREVSRPANDLVTGATEIASYPHFLSQDNRVAADTQDTEADPSCVNDNDPFVQGKYLWYTWLATTSVPMQVNTALSQDTLSGVAVYSGSPGALVEVGCSWADFSNGQGGRVIFTPSIGVRYYFRIWADSRTWATVNLFLDEVRTPIPGDVIVGCGAIWIITEQGAVRDYLFLVGYVRSGIPTNGSLDPDLPTQLYVSQLGADQIVHVDVTTQPMVVVGYTPVAPADGPEGNAFLATGRLITAFRNTAEFRVYTTPGMAVETVWPAEVENDGTGWVDLARDLHVLYYTSGGRRIMRFDTASGSQLSDFTVLPVDGDAIAQGLRVLPDGSIMLADYTRMIRVSPGGTIQSVYTFPDGEDVHVLDIDPEAESVWVGLTQGNWLYHVRISDGLILLQMQLPTFPANLPSLCGVAVVDGARTINPPNPPGPGPGGEGCPPARFTLQPAPAGCADVGEL